MRKMNCGQLEDFTEQTEFISDKIHDDKAKKAIATGQKKGRVAK